MLIIFNNWVPRQFNHFFDPLQNTGNPRKPQSFLDFGFKANKPVIRLFPRHSTRLRTFLSSLCGSETSQQLSAIIYIPIRYTSILHNRRWSHCDVEIISITAFIDLLKVFPRQWLRKKINLMFKFFLKLTFWIKQELNKYFIRHVY